MIYFSTLDLDKLTEEQFLNIRRKICSCPGYRCLTHYVTQKGYHVRLQCVAECDICRMVFDDQKRFAADLGRPKCKQNVLFKPFSAKCLRSDPTLDPKFLKKMKRIDPL